MSQLTGTIKSFPFPTNSYSASYCFSKEPSQCFLFAATTTYIKSKKKSFLWPWKKQFLEKLFLLRTIANTQNTLRLKVINCIQCIVVGKIELIPMILTVTKIHAEFFIILVLFAMLELASVKVICLISEKEGPLVTFVIWSQSTFLVSNIPYTVPFFSIGISPILFLLSMLRLLMLTN